MSAPPDGRTTMRPRHFDDEALRTDMFGSRSALRAVLETFSPWLVEARSQLRGAIAADDREALGRVVHRMRGALAQLRAAQAVGHIRALETQCRQEGGLVIPPDHPALAVLDAELDALAGEVDDYLADLRD